MPETRFAEQGSIAGIPILVGRTSIIGGGRNVVVVETPSDEPPGLLLAGRQALRFRVESKLAGESWRSDAERLREATIDGQTVEFQHPTWGAYQVKLANGLEISQDIARERGVSRFELDLVVDPELPSFVFVSDDPGNALPNAGATVEALGAVQVGKVSPSFSATIAATFSDLAAGLDAANARVTAALIGIQTIQDSISRYQDAIDQLANSPVALYNGFSALVRQLFDGIAAYPQDPDATLDVRSRTAVQATQDLADSSVDLTTIPPVESQAEAEKREAATKLVGASQAAASAVLYETLGVVEPADAAESLAEIEQINGLAFELYDLILDGDLYDAHQAARALINERLRALTQDLPSVIEYQAKAPTSALLVAFDLYGAAGAVGRELQIERRNSLTNPARVPETQALDVVAP